MNIQEERQLESSNHLLHSCSSSRKRAAERSFTENGISMPLKQEILSVNKGYPYTLWNAIYMHKLRCEARGCWRGRKDPLSTGVAFTGQQCNTCFYPASASLHIRAPLNLQAPFKPKR